MHQPISCSDLVLLFGETDAAAARLRRRLCLTLTDQDDLRHDLLADLIRRLPSFDPSRGTLGAFAGTVLRHQATRIAARHARKLRLQGGPLLSLDAPTPSGTSLGDTLSGDEGLAAWHGRTAAERHIDLTAALDRLDAPDQALCAAAAHSSVDELADQGFGSRAGIYRRLRALRSELTAYGLHAA